MTHLSNCFRYRGNSMWPAWGLIAPRRTVSSAPARPGGTNRRRENPPAHMPPPDSELIAAKMHDTIDFRYEHDV